MGKEKEKSVADDDLDLYDDESVIASDGDGIEMLGDELADELGDGLDDAVRSTNGRSKKASPKLAVKRRLDAYLERKWFRDHGWEDDDELFNDDFFSDEGPDSRQHA